MDRAKSDRQEKSADNNQSGLESFSSTGFAFGAVGTEVIFPAEKIVLSLSLSPCDVMQPGYIRWYDEKKNEADWLPLTFAPTPSAPMRKCRKREKVKKLGGCEREKKNLARHVRIAFNDDDGLFFLSLSSLCLVYVCVRTHNHRRRIVWHQRLRRCVSMLDV
jgi:hypothetical protein